MIRVSKGRRSLVVGTIVLLVSLLLTAPASAGVSWCRADPVVTLDGVTYQVHVLVPDSVVAQITGPIGFTFVSPVGTSASLVLVDAGFNGYGETVRFQEHAAQGIHRLVVTVPHDGERFPVRVDLFRDGTRIRAITGATDRLVVIWPT